MADAQREQTVQARLEAAERRDRAGLARDVAARARDQAAEARDLAMAGSDAPIDDTGRPVESVSPADVTIRAAGRRKRAARWRALAAEHRALAAADRESAAADRREATRERRQALADRKALAVELAIAAVDPLTGARSRATGLNELAVALERCRRTGTRLSVAYVDVVRVKAAGGGGGHPAADEVLERVVRPITERLRPCDLIIRLGGDESICAMPGLSVANARERFGQIAETLYAQPGWGAISSGFAEFTQGEPATGLIARVALELTGERPESRLEHPSRRVGWGASGAER